MGLKILIGMVAFLPFILRAAQRLYREKGFRFSYPLVVVVLAWWGISVHCIVRHIMEWEQQVMEDWQMWCILRMCCYCLS